MPLCSSALLLVQRDEKLPSWRETIEYTIGCPMGCSATSLNDDASFAYKKAVPLVTPGTLSVGVYCIFTFLSANMGAHKCLLIMQPNVRRYHHGASLTKRNTLTAPCGGRCLRSENHQHGFREIGIASPKLSCRETRQIAATRQRQGQETIMHRASQAIFAASNC